MANPDKGLNRGGSLGQEGELGEKGANVNQPKQQPGQQPAREIKPNQPNIKPGQGNIKPGKGIPQKGQEPQRGGLRREPDLEGREKDTEHEVD